MRPHFTVQQLISATSEEHELMAKLGAIEVKCNDLLASRAMKHITEKEHEKRLMELAGEAALVSHQLRILGIAKKEAS